MLTDVVWLGCTEDGEYDDYSMSVVCAATSKLRARGLLISYIKANKLGGSYRFKAFVASMTIDNLGPRLGTDDSLVEYLQPEEYDTGPEEDVRSLKKKINSKLPQTDDFLDYNKEFENKKNISDDWNKALAKYVREIKERL